MDAAEALKITKIKVNKAEISSLQVVLWFAFPPQAPAGNQQSVEELLADTATLAGTQGLFLSPQPLFLQANPRPAAELPPECLLCTVCSNTPRLCCSLKECLERANTQMHQQQSGS